MTYRVLAYDTKGQRVYSGMVDWMGKHLVLDNRLFQLAYRWGDLWVFYEQA